MGNSTKNCCLRRMEFDNGFKGKVTKFHGNGDGSVNFKSLVKCGDWARSPKQKSYGFIQKEFPGVEHNAMLSDDDTINYILSELTNYRDYPRVNEKLNITNLMEIRLFWSYSFEIGEIVRYYNIKRHRISTHPFFSFSSNAFYVFFFLHSMVNLTWNVLACSWLYFHRISLTWIYEMYKENIIKKMNIGTIIDQF